MTMATAIIVALIGAIASITAAWISSQANVSPATTGVIQSTRAKRSVIGKISLWIVYIVTGLFTIDLVVPIIIIVVEFPHVQNLNENLVLLFISGVVSAIFWTIAIYLHRRLR